MNSCNKASNNKYFNCPPRMDDCRHFTNWSPNYDINKPLNIDNKQLNANEYRNYLIHNATKLIEKNRKNSEFQNSCAPCMKPHNIGTMLNEKYELNCNKYLCKSNLKDKNGIGQGINYNYNLNNNFNIIKNNSSDNCCVSSNNLFNYYGYNVNLK